MALSPWFGDLCRFNTCPNLYRGFRYDPEDFWSLPSGNGNLMQWPGFYRQLNDFSLNDHAIKLSRDKFQVNMDVQQFEPAEISVKTSGNTVTIEAKHEEKQDEHGFISRHFVRKYTIPKDHDISRLESKLSTDGVLTITAPKLDEKETDDVRNIPITQTGLPTRTQKLKSNADEEAVRKSKL